MPIAENRLPNAATGCFQNKKPPAAVGRRDTLARIQNLPKNNLYPTKGRRPRFAQKAFHRRHSFAPKSPCACRLFRPADDGRAFGARIGNRQDAVDRCCGLTATCENQPDRIPKSLRRKGGETREFYKKRRRIFAKPHSHRRIAERQEKSAQIEVLRNGMKNRAKPRSAAENRDPPVKG